MRLLFLLVLLPALSPPAAAQGPAPADTLRILSWNIQMLPPLVHPNGKCRRARHLADLLSERRYDLIVFQEAFHPRPRKLIRQRLAEEYPHRAGPANQKWFSLRTNAGVWILSRLPLRNPRSIEFRAKAELDNKLARKGALMVRFRFRDHDVQLVGTHLNAGGPMAVRYAQMRQIREELLAPQAEAGVPQLIAGDLNTNRFDTTRYDSMLTLLDAYNGPPDERGVAYSSYARTNDLKDGRQDKPGKIIDYVLVRPQGVRLRVERSIREFERPWSKRRRDLSDHYAVEARIVFPPRRR